MDLMRLRLENVSFSVRKTPILHDISAGIPEQAITGLIGPNGAGKSTLLRLLGGLRKPSRGRVLIDGREVHSIPLKERARFLAMLPQNPSVGFGFTVREVVTMGRYPFAPRLAPLSESCRAAIEEAMRVTDTSSLAERRITELSGGERQRVFLARALAQEPRVLLLDEPTTNLDIRYQLEFFELLAALQKERRLTVVMALHDLSWALRFCHHAFVLDNGRMVAQGPTEEVINEQLIERVFGVKTRIVEAESRRHLELLH